MAFYSWLLELLC